MDKYEAQTGQPESQKGQLGAQTLLMMVMISDVREIFLQGRTDTLLVRQIQKSDMVSM